METLGSFYGRCPCGGEYEAKLVEVRFTESEAVQALPEVPQASCPDCGARVYKAAVIERLEAAYAAAQPAGA